MNAAAPLRLFLIRHGQTVWSLSGQHTGRSDIVLTAAGEDEARALAPGFHDVVFSHVLTSPLARARQTAGFAGLGAGAVIEADLAEWDYGDYEGRHSDEIRIGHPGWNVFRDGCPNGESAEQVSLRADRLIARLGALWGNVALFSHGQFLPCLAVRWIGLAVLEAQHLALGTGSLSILGSNPSHPEIRVIARWNLPAAGACVGLATG